MEQMSERAHCKDSVIDVAASVPNAGRAVTVVDAYEAAEGVKLPVHRNLATRVEVATSLVSTMNVSISSVVLIMSGSSGSNPLL